MLNKSINIKKEINKESYVIKNTGIKKNKQRRVQTD
jgi:hypothetical protein